MTEAPHAVAAGALSPTAITPVEYDEFTLNFAEYEERVQAGEIFKVRGNPHLRGFADRYIEPRIAGGNWEYFGENPPDIADSQALQKALFGELAERTEFWCDSFIRLRRTVGRGAFVGPHLDKYEELPAHGVNFWVSFRDLEPEESLVFYDAALAPSGNMSGTFKPGVYVAPDGRLLPRDDLLAHSMAAAISAGEYFVFNSGRVLHSSPFGVVRDRITADQRIFLPRDPSDANFDQIVSYYHSSDLDAFDGSRPGSEVLADLQDQYAGRVPFFFFRFHAAGTNEEKQRLIRDHLEELDPVLLVKLAARVSMAPTDVEVGRLLAAHPDSVSVRLGLLRLPLSRRQRVRVCKETLRLPPENAQKTYALVFDRLPLHAARSPSELVLALERRLGPMLRRIGLESARARIQFKLYDRYRAMRFPEIRQPA